MYSHVKSRVKHCNSLSEYFEYSVGLRQGEVVSPLLVSLFLEDLEMFLQNNANAGIELNDIVLLVLLFADDMVILGKTPQELQAHLNNWEIYCDKWSLEVNSSKTKRGALREDKRWSYKNEPIEIVDIFNYIGCVLKYTGNFAKNHEFIIGKSLKALNIVLHNLKQYPFSPKSCCELFDAFVGSTLSGFTKSKDIGRVHSKFCKAILNVRKSTASVGVYGDLGRYPLYISRYTRMISYWSKISQSDNIIISSLYLTAL